MATTVRHYTAYRPRPFTFDERKDVTLLFGGLTWKHERLMQGALENMGYRAMPLPEHCAGRTSTRGRSSSTRAPAAPRSSRRAAWPAS